MDTISLILQPYFDILQAFPKVHSSLEHLNSGLVNFLGSSEWRSEATQNSSVSIIGSCHLLLTDIQQFHLKRATFIDLFIHRPLPLFLRPKRWRNSRKSRRWLKPPTRKRLGLRTHPNTPWRMHQTLKPALQKNLSLAFVHQRRINSLSTSGSFPPSKRPVNASRLQKTLHPWRTVFANCLKKEFQMRLWPYNYPRKTSPLWNEPSRCRRRSLASCTSSIRKRTDKPFARQSATLKALRSSEARWISSRRRHDRSCLGPIIGFVVPIRLGRMVPEPFPNTRMFSMQYCILHVFRALLLTFLAFPLACVFINQSR